MTEGLFGDIDQRQDCYVVYHSDTGELHSGATGPIGTAEATSAILPPGLSVLKVPHAIFYTLPDDLAPLKAAMQAMIDAQAGEVRARFITITKGQDASYLNKSIEARAWLADNAAPVPGLENEARLRGMTVAALVAEVMARVSAWAPLDGVIEGLRLRAKEEIGAAANIGGIVAASAVDWNAGLAAASA